MAESGEARNRPAGEEWIPSEGGIGELVRLFEVAPLGVIFVGRDGCICAANQAASRILGWSPEAMCGVAAADSRWAAFRADGSPFPPAEIPVLRVLERGSVEAGVEMGVFNPVVQRHRWIKINAMPLFRPGQTKPDLACALFDDITAAKQIERRERLGHRSLELVARSAPLKDVLEAIVRGSEGDDPSEICTILLLDREGRHLLTGAAPGMPDFYNRAIHGAAIGIGVGSCGTAAATGQRVVVEDVFNHPYWKDYTHLAAQAGLGACWSEPIRSSRGRILGTFAIYHRRRCAPTAEDIARIEAAANLAAIAIEHSRTLEELERQARTDYLTGLDNRRHFWEQAEVEVVRARRYGGELSLLMIDVDNFKTVNDSWGHKVGDLVLQALSQTCRDCLREVDVIGRLGGEEFGVLLPETEGMKAVEVAERLRESIAASPVVLPDGERVAYTVSVGVTTLDGQNADLEILFGQADRAMYAAKEGGRNRVCPSPVVGLLAARLMG